MLDCQKPNKGEQLVKEYLEQHGYSVIDVSKDQHYWSQDIDFIAIKGTETIKIEVKYDTWIHSSRNLFIELLADVDRNKCGWIDYCKADYLYYVDAVDNSCYVIALEDVREYLKIYPYQIKNHIEKNKFSQGALVNIDFMSKIYDVGKLNLQA